MSAPGVSQSGVALLAVLFALTLLMLLALPFGVSMSAGADAAMREVEAVRSQQASASVRDLLLAEAALSHPAFDETRAHDSLDEWPEEVWLPETMTALEDEGRTTLGGSVEDLQRYVALDSVSPLVLGNLLGTAVRLAEELAPDASVMVVNQADALPDSGYLWIAHEIIRYGHKEGNRLLDLERGLFHEQGFARPEDAYHVRALVLDYRCVLAAAWPFMDRSGSMSRRRPYAAVTELAGITKAGLGGFTPSEIDRFNAALVVEGMAQTAATWGRPERVFDGLLPGVSKTLRVKSALHLGAGSTVRLRDLSNGRVEYGLVMSVTNERNVRDLRLPSVFRLALLTPVTQEFLAGTTVVEPLVPAPVNLNTASRRVLMALFSNVRRAADVRIHAGDNRQRSTPPRSISRNEAEALADEILALRVLENGEPGQGPFKGWQDLVERVITPRLQAASNTADKQRWIYFYRNLRTGRDSVLEMGTAPIGFDSGPWVRYRAAASIKRSRVAPGIAARHERVGTAAAVPGYHLEHSWTTQKHFEDAFVLDRRSPFWSTTPINLGALQPGDLGNDPAGRYFPHLVGVAYPDLGLGAPRYASTETADAGIRPLTAMARLGRWARSEAAADSFVQALSPRGHEIERDGPYRMLNVGPSEAGGTPRQSGGRHDVISFPFSGEGGFMRPFAAQFWLEPQFLEGVTVFDHGDGDPDRNRFALHGRDGNLVLEVIDECGIDPNPSESPAGVERTAVEIELPLAELGLPPDMPVHLNISAQTGRASGIAMDVDGMPRGKRNYVTYLTSPIDVFDPALPNNGNALPPAYGNQRYFEMQVEDTEGFPPVGVLRVGTELFEYTSLNGNAFVCQWNDSMGGRGARQVAREHRPNIPTDNQGNPTVDIGELSDQGINLDVFPEHPVGAKVELYGYSTPLSPDSPMMVGETRLEGAIGSFAVARAFLTSGLAPITLQIPGRPPINIGEGIDETWAGDLELADPIVPVAPDRTYPPEEAQEAISEAFPTGGGYALLIQRRIQFSSNIPGTVTVSEPAGGVEVIKFGSRQGSTLRNVQRAQLIPGDDSHISTNQYDGTARKFVMNWNDWPWDPTVPQVYWDNIPTMMLWVVPITIPVQNTSTLWDPQNTGLSEWVQLYPDGGDPADLEWVRYDAIMEGKHLTRGNRRAWDRLRWTLTSSNQVTNVQVGPLGPTNTPGGAENPPWGTVAASAGFVGYVPQVEEDFPQIYRARESLAFRGDMLRDFYQGRGATSSHAHSNAIVTQCQRLGMRRWGSYSAFSGRPGRHDRIAIVQGSVASGTARPAVEWHTVTWCARRFNSDNLSPDANPAERLGPWPFQLIAFTEGVQGAFIGPPSDQEPQDPRSYDRIVKFPSGELPAAWCDEVHVGAGVGGEAPVSGFIDEVEIVQHALPGLVVEEAFDDSAMSFRVHLGLTYDAAGPRWWRQNVTASHPRQGGLVMVDGEIIAYSELRNGEFTVATNGRGMLDTEARSHDHGAQVLFMTNRPAAILSGGVSSNADVLQIQSIGAQSERAGTLRLGQELLHYTWVRGSGDSVQLEMPRWSRSGEYGSSSLSRGLFRGRYGTVPAAASSGEAVVQWPFRYWDRYVERSDDPELAYFQLTTTAAPSFFRSLRWREEVRDLGAVTVVCMVRTDSRAPWDADPVTTAGLWQFTDSDWDEPHVLAAQGSRLEVRFATRYNPGALDLVNMQSHGWKTTARISEARVDYEGEPRVFDERVTLR